jgi:hypothetical protein
MNNKNTPIFIFSSGIFTKACGSNSSPTRKCISCLLIRMSRIPVTTAPEGTTYSSPSEMNGKKKKKRKEN